MLVVPEQFTKQLVAGSGIPVLQDRQSGKGHEKSACGFHVIFMVVSQNLRHRQGVRFCRFHVMALTFIAGVNNNAEGGEKDCKNQDQQLTADGLHH